MTSKDTIERLKDTIQAESYDKERMILDLLADIARDDKKSPILDPFTMDVIDIFFMHHGYVRAVKNVKDAGNLGLKEAKEIVDREIKGRLQKYKDNMTP